MACMRPLPGSIECARSLRSRARESHPTNQPVVSTDGCWCRRAGPPFHYEEARVLNCTGRPAGSPGSFRCGIVVSATRNESGNRPGAHDGDGRVCMNATRARVQRKRVCTTSYAVGVLDRSLYGVFFRNKHKHRYFISNHLYEYTYTLYPHEHIRKTELPSS
jgi:hypothetical protein